MCVFHHQNADNQPQLTHMERKDPQGFSFPSVYSVTIEKLLLVYIKANESIDLKRGSENPPSFPYVVRYTLGKVRIRDVIYLLYNSSS